MQHVHAINFVPSTISVPISFRGHTMDYSELINALHDRRLESLIASHQLYGEVDPCFAMDNIARQTTIDLSNVQFEIISISITGNLIMYAERHDMLGRTETIKAIADIRPLSGSNMQRSLKSGMLLKEYKFTFRNLDIPNRIITIDADTIRKN